MYFLKLENIALGALIIIPLIFLPFSGNEDYFYQPKVYGMIIFSFIYLWHIYKERKHIHSLIQPDLINRSLFVYFTLLTTSLFFAEDYVLALTGGYMRYEGYSTLILYMLLFLAARNVSPKSILESRAFILSASIVALYGVFQHFGFDPFPRDSIRSTWNVAFSTMGNQNFLGSFLVLLLPIALHLALKKNNWLYVVTYSIILFCLLATRTSSALVGAFVVIISYGFLSLLNNQRQYGVNKNTKIVIAASILIILFFNIQTNNSTFGDFLSIKNDLDSVIQQKDGYEQAGSFRIFIWKRVALLVAKKPFFGYGIENLGPVFERSYHDDILSLWGYTLTIDKTHNEYLHIAFSTGIPSLLAYMFFIYLILKEGFNASRTKKETIPIFAAVLGYLSQAFFNISIVSVAYVFWIFLGVLSNNINDKTSC